jgi:hypothetical protein
VSYTELKIIAREVAEEMARERRNNPTPPTPPAELGVVEGVFVTICAVIFFGGFIASFFFDLPAMLKTLAGKANEYIPFVELFAGLLALILGGILYGVREIVGHPAYAPGEILLGGIVAGYSIHQQDFAGFLGFVAGVRVIIDGYNRIGTLKVVRAKWGGTHTSAAAKSK